MRLQHYVLLAVFLMFICGYFIGYVDGARIQESNIEYKLLNKLSGA